MRVLLLLLCLYGCRACGTGAYIEEGSCRPCPPGFFCVGDVLQACPPDAYNAMSRATACTDCPAGTVSSEGSTNLTDCLPAGELPYYLEDRDDADAEDYVLRLLGASHHRFINLIPEASGLSYALVDIRGELFTNPSTQRMQVAYGTVGGFTDEVYPAMALHFSDGRNTLVSWYGNGALYTYDAAAYSTSLVLGSDQQSGFLAGCNTRARLPSSQLAIEEGALGVHLSLYNQRGDDGVLPLTRMVLLEGPALQVMHVNERPDPTKTNTYVFCGITTNTGLSPNISKTGKTVYSAMHAYFLLLCTSSCPTAPSGPYLARVPLYTVLPGGVSVEVCSAARFALRTFA